MMMMRAALRRAAPLRDSAAFAVVLVLALALAPGAHGMFPRCSSTPRVCARLKLYLAVLLFARSSAALRLRVEEGKLSARREDAA